MHWLPGPALRGTRLVRMTRGESTEVRPVTGFALVFPGQGSQSTGMLDTLAAEWPQVQATFAEASSALDYDLWQLVQDNPNDQLDQTRYTQPAMLTAGVATHRVWLAAGGAQPDFMAGHSLGEYSALVAAGILEFVDAVRLVSVRARLMQEAVAAGEGGMAAILGLDDDAVCEVCETVASGRIVEPVNYNSPGQVVIAGHADAVAQALEAARAAGAKRAVDLPVSVPAHSSLMKPAADELATHLDRTAFAAPAVPVVHNVDAGTHADPEGIRDALRRQLYNPVRWTESVRVMAAGNVTRVAELGPGRVLAGLTRRIDRNLQGLPVDDPASLQKALLACSEAN